MTPEPVNRLWPSNEAFFASLDEGIKLVKGDQYKKLPAPEDLKTLEHLLAVFVASTIQMDPKAVADPKVGEILMSVRVALLMAYNLGRESNQP